MRVSILTNGPGELWGWVRPAVIELRKRGHSISLWLLPCPFSSGLERNAASLLGIDKLEGPYPFPIMWREIIREKTDCVIQLGGDVSFGARMAQFSRAPLTVYSYRHKKNIPDAKLLTAFPEQANFPNVIPIGDLVKNAVNLDSEKASSVADSWVWRKDSNSPRLLFLPGSRPKIRSAVISWLCSLRDKISQIMPDVRYRTLFPQFIQEDEINIWSKEGLNPVKAGSGMAMRGADYALTQPGTNNFEMMHTGLPGLVIAPEHFLSLIPVSGIAGFFTGIPGLGNLIRRKALMHTVKSWNGYISLPNRTFRRDLLSEMYGNISVSEVAQKIKAEIYDNDKLSAKRKELLSFSGKNNAASRLADISTGPEDL